MDGFFQSKKGQLSIEFILIFAIFLSVLLIFIGQFNKIKDRAQTDIQKNLVRKTSIDIENAINSICILGDNNIRELDFYFLEKTFLMKENDRLILASDSANVTLSTKCTVQFSSPLELNKKIKIEGKDSTVKIYAKDS
ncbi:MAG: class III signal peptide-containing protein [Candidatus Micrarchaeota archaeon]|nr:class III signal peptide-containing protein [Candidatus Micrarchaeota archaeon]